MIDESFYSTLTIFSNVRLLFVCKQLEARRNFDFEVEVDVGWAAGDYETPFGWGRQGIGTGIGTEEIDPVTR